MFGKNKKETNYTGMPGFVDEPQTPDLVVPNPNAEKQEVPAIKTGLELPTTEENATEEVRVQAELDKVNAELEAIKAQKAQAIAPVTQPTETPKIVNKYQIIEGQLLDNGLHKYTIISTSSLGYVGEEFAL